MLALRSARHPLSKPDPFINSQGLRSSGWINTRFSKALHAPFHFTDRIPEHFALLAECRLCQYKKLINRLWIRFGFFKAFDVEHGGINFRRGDERPRMNDADYSWSAEEGDEDREEAVIFLIADLFCDFSLNEQCHRFRVYR